jgi:hypothetical protein
MRVAVPHIREESLRSPLSPIVWFAVLGAPGAWAIQFGVGYWLSQAKCSPAGAMWGIGLDTWIIVLSAIAIPTALAAGLTGFLVFHATQGSDNAPPGGRNQFLATIGMAVTPIFVGIMALNLVGVLTYSGCPQG